MTDPGRALLDARTEAEILAALAAGLWRKHHEGECPPDAIPTAAGLAKWLPDCPADARGASGEALALALAADAAKWHPLAERGEDGKPVPFGLVAFVKLKGWAGWAIGGGIDAVHAKWADAPKDKRGKHPLGALVRAWQSRPRDVPAETRKDRRILPKIADGMNIQDRLPIWPAATPEPQLPLGLFAEPASLRVPLLDLVDFAGVPIMAQGRGAPLVFRVVIRTLLAVGMAGRGGGLIRPAVKVADFASAFLGKNYRPGRHWPRLLETLQTVHNARVVLNGYSYALCMVHRFPTDGDPDGKVEMIVNLPEGASEGPEVELPALDALGRESAPRYRAYIAAQTLNWKTGVTRVPANKRRRVWLWTKDVERYPVHTLATAKRNAFGASDRKNRTKAQIRAAYEDLPGLVLLPNQHDPKTGVAGFRVVPADAVGGKVLTGEKRGANR